MLRSYTTIGRAQSFARTLQTRFPDRTFTVILSPFASYPFRWLIRTGTAYVGR